MNRIVLYSTVSADGVLKLTLPPDPDTIDREVRVTVEPVNARKMTQEEWRKEILETAGKWQGELVRPDQGEFEKRMPLS